MDGAKVSEEVADIRNVEPGKSIDSPNRFYEFSNPPEMLDFIENLEMSDKSQSASNWSQGILKNCMSFSLNAEKRKASGFYHDRRK